MKNEDFATAGVMIAGGIGLYFTASMAKDPAAQMAMKAGGILLGISGLVVGGESLLEKLGLGSGTKDPTKDYEGGLDIQPGTPKGILSGKILAPADGSEVLTDTFKSSYKVKARISNGSDKFRRVVVRAVGNETYTFGSPEVVSVALGEWTIAPGKSIEVSGDMTVGTYVPGVFNPQVTLTLYADDEALDTIKYQYD